MDDLEVRLTTLADPAHHAAQMAQLEALHTSFEAMIERAKTLPSLPELVRNLNALTAEVWRLRESVATLEAECYALRQRELLRFWEDEDAAGDQRQR